MRRVIPGLKKLPTLKPEVLAALISFVFVLTIVIVHSLIVLLNPEGEAAKAYWTTFPPLLLINIVMPLVVYIGVKIFLAPPKSPFPDIDLAFEAGLQALSQHGIPIRQTPIYLVVGTPEARTIKQMMDVSKRTFDFSHITADGQALHWYGSAENTYLFLTGIGNICQLTKDLARHIAQTSPDENHLSNGDEFRGTIDVRALASNNGGQPDPSPADHSVAMVDTGGNFSQTIRASDIGRESPLSTPTPQAREPETPRRAPSKQLSSREKLTLQKQRLTHLCELLARQRNPVCAHNGVLVAIQNRLVEEFPSELARQIKRDLTTICDATGVVSTVTAIITGFENDPGCREFVARLSESKGASFLNRRFGKSYRSWETPSQGHLKEISHESIENFDQYIYSLFTQHDALSSRHVTGNRDMVKFLCWIYSRFFEGLEITLTSGFNFEEFGLEDAPRLAGCYFMGIGDSQERQFFSEGVFDRIDENQGELEWTSRIRRREETLSTLSQLIFLVGLIAIAALAIMVVLKSMNGS